MRTPDRVSNIPDSEIMTAIEGVGPLGAAKYWAVTVAPAYWPGECDGADRTRWVREDENTWRLEARVE